MIQRAISSTVDSFRKRKPGVVCSSETVIWVLNWLIKERRSVSGVLRRGAGKSLSSDIKSELNSRQQSDCDTTWFMFHVADHQLLITSCQHSL